MGRKEIIVRNAAAIAAYVMFDYIFMRAARLLPGDWIRFSSAEVLATVVALALAIRFGARVAAWVIAACLGYSLSMLIAHATFGIAAAQGFTVHFAVLVASSIAVIAMLIVSKFEAPVRATP